MQSSSDSVRYDLLIRWQLVPNTNRNAAGLLRSGGRGRVAGAVQNMKPLSAAGKAENTCYRCWVPESGATRSRGWRAGLTSKGQRLACCASPPVTVTTYGAANQTFQPTQCVSARGKA
jgi:hypothetical protein